MFVHGVEAVLAVAFLVLWSRRLGYSAAAPLNVGTAPLGSVTPSYEIFLRG